MTTFHRSSQRATRTIEVLFCGKVVKYNFTPKYLGIINPHLCKICEKLKSRCNIIQILIRLEVGVFSISSMALIYSTAEYCCPVWSHSTHVKKSTPHSCLRIKTGAIKSSSIPWLSVLANIKLPDRRRKIALEREVGKINENIRVGTRFISRTPLRMKMED